MTCNIQLMFLLLLCPAWAEVFMWQPPSLGNSLEKRAGGYRPEYNDCGEGHDCSSCGDEFEQCAASTTLVLFCYNPTAGQTCCPNGQGKACNAGYYCATDGSGRTWCCLNELDLAECATSHGVTGLQSAVSSTSQLAATTITRLISVTVQELTTSFSSPGTSSYTTRRANTTAWRNTTSTIITGDAGRGFDIDRGFSLALLSVLLGWAIIL